MPAPDPGPQDGLRFRRARTPTISPRCACTWATAAHCTNQAAGLASHCACSHGTASALTPAAVNRAGGGVVEDVEVSLRHPPEGSLVDVVGAGAQGLESPRRARGPAS